MKSLCSGQQIVFTLKELNKRNKEFMNSFWKLCAVNPQMKY